MDIERADGRIRLGALEFDPDARLTIVGGCETLLDFRSSLVLKTLVESHGQRVSKDELLRAAWPRQTVHENSLAKAISRLRPAIRGSGLEIAAAYGAGYTLRPLADGARDEPVEGPGSEDKSLASNVAWAGLSSRTMIAIFAALLLVAGLVYVSGRSPANPVVDDNEPVTHDSPDAVATILWVDDHPSNNSAEIAALKKRRIAVHLTESTDDALKLLAMNSYRLVISDLGRGEDRLAGLRMIQAMKKRGITVPVLVYTVRPKERFRQEAQRRLVAEAGAVDVAVTPEEVRAKALARLAPPT